MTEPRQSNPTAPSSFALFREGWKSVKIDLTQGIQRNNLAFLVSQSYLSFIISVVMTLALSIYLGINGTGFSIALWALPNLLILCLLLRQRKSRPAVQPTDTGMARSLRARNRGALQMAGLGLLWGSVALYLPDLSDSNKLMTLFMLGGMSGGGALMLASVPLFAMLFMLCVMLPPLIAMLLLPELAGMAIGWMLYFIAMVNVAVLMYASVSAQINAGRAERKFHNIQLEQALSKAAFEAPDISSAIRACLQLLVTHQHWHLGHVYLKQDIAGQSRLWSSQVWVSPQLNDYAAFTRASEGYSFSDGEGPPGMVMTSGKPAWVLLDHNDPQLKGVPRAKECGEAGLNTAVLVPIEVHDGIGAILEVFSRDVRPYSEDELNTLMFAGLQLGRSLEKDQIENQRNFLIAVLESVEDVLVACDSEGNLFYDHNPDVFRSGKTERIHYSQWVSVFRLKDAEGNELELKDIPLYQALQGDIVRDAIISFDVKGSTRQFRCSGQQMHDSSGQTLGAMVSMHDITDEIELQEQLRQSQKLEAVGQLTGGIAHDFNNLLTVIQGNLILCQQTSDPIEIADMLEEAITASKRGAALTQSLLAFSRRQTLHPETLRLEQVLDNLVTPLSRSLGEAINLKTSISPDAANVFADENQLVNALLNLCINARDAMDGKGILMIKADNAFLDDDFIAAHPDAHLGPHLRISVIDNGCGMAEAELKQAFDPFFTTKASGQGSGLGLSMVYGFARQSDGYVTMASEAGKGTQVDLYLPSTALPKKTKQIATEPESTNGANRLILVLEDNISVRDITAKLLTQLGYRVLQAGDENEAVAIAKTHPDIELMLSDIILKGDLNGLQVAEVVKQIQPGIKTVFMSGFTKDLVQNNDRNATEIQLLAKPYSQSELAAFVAKALV